MKTIELWLWRVTDPDTGRRYKTRYRLTEQEALALDSTAERVEGSRELRRVPDSPDEFDYTTPRGGS